MQKNKQWFSIIFLIGFLMFMMTLFWFIVSQIISNKENRELASRKIQAKNYVEEWIEGVLWFMYTKMNQNRMEWWKNSVQHLNGNYVINILDSWYQLESWIKEEITNKNSPHPYIREIGIRNWNDDNEKIITSKVYYHWDKYISMERLITNRYKK